jgi:dihydropteroate synthase
VRPALVGIVNCTPDSFFDGGRYDPVAQAERLLAEGADWLDIGGESTRPQAVDIPADEQLRRVRPVFEALAGRGLTLSIDTRLPAVAAAARAWGATVLNDVAGLTDPELVAVSADFEATVVMHSRGTPATMTQLTAYDDVVTEVRDQLLAAAARARSPRVYLDPGLGFAKTAPQSLALLRHTAPLVATGLPVFIGASRKSFLGATLGLPQADDRLVASVAAALFAAQAGAAALRVHDVAATRQALDLWAALAAPPPAQR